MQPFYKVINGLLYRVEDGGLSFYCVDERGPDSLQCEVYDADIAVQEYANDL